MERTTKSKRQALVTGAGSGIGRCYALRLAALGCDLLLVGEREAPLLAVRAEIEAAHPVRVQTVACDLAQLGAAEALFARAEALGFTPDVLVNNAGIIKRIPMTEMSVEDFRQVVDIDLIGPFVCAKAVIPGMLKKGHGKIINICSMMSELGRETVSAYAAAIPSTSLLCPRPRRAAGATRRT